MAGSTWFNVSVATALAGIAVSVSGGCACSIGADSSSYEPGEGSGGAPGSTGNSDAPGSGAGGTGASAQGSGGESVGGGVPECSGRETKCSENTPRRCVDGRWENGDPCARQTCVDGTCIGECGSEDVRCSDDRPQRCDEHGAWEEAEPCPAAAPVCDRGKCVPPSCVGLAETCGPGSDESCCATAEAAPGGTFNRDNDTRYPATVSGFLLERFEVTVGRFRRFVEAYPGSKPAPGAGAHPLIEGSGWNAEWTSNLPADAAALKAAVNCSPTYKTWRDDTDGGTEHLPMNCLNWYVAFAFCAWDGGRLATEAEWNYAAAGGDEQRAYPWSNPASSTRIDDSYAVYDCAGDRSASGECAFSDIQAVGSRSPKGDGRWGQADLAGNLREWVLDWYAADYPNECNDCANLTSATGRGFRGGSFEFDDSEQPRSTAPDLLSSRRNGLVPSISGTLFGARCARTP